MKYEMHIVGTNETQAFNTEIDALRAANQINKIYLNQRSPAGDSAPLLVAIVEKEGAETNQWWAK